MKTAFYKQTCVSFMHNILAIKIWNFIEFHVIIIETKSIPQALLLQQSKYKFLKLPNQPFTSFLQKYYFRSDTKYFIMSK